MAATGIRLLVLQGPDRGRELLASASGAKDTNGSRRAEITIGRQSDRKLRFTDDYVSRHHAHLVPSTRGLQLVDDGSLNGTLHNGTRLSPGVPVSIRDGDELAFGPYTVVTVRFIDGDGPHSRGTPASRGKARPARAVTPPREWFGSYAVYYGLDRGPHDRVDIATPESQSQPVVLKRFNRSLSRPARRRIRDHVDAARRWDHAHVATIRACGEHEGTLYLVRPYIDGVSLDRLCATCATEIEPPLAAYVVERAAATLAAAHEQDAAFVQPYLSHRNLVLARTGDVGFINFGLPLTAQMVAGMEDLPPLEARFMAPECSGSTGAPVDARAEVFTLGLLLFELLAGAPVDLAEAAVLQPIEGVRPTVPRPLAEVTTRALKLHAARRYNSPGEMSVALRAALRKVAPDYDAATAAQWVRTKLRPPPVIG